MPSDHAREELILKHLPQVRFIARDIYERINHRIEFEDLVSTGALGLIKAVDKFDPKRGIQLRTYAEHKIRGALLDSLRKLDAAGRVSRRCARELEEVTLSLTRRLQRAPTHDEIATEMRLSPAAYRAAYRAATASFPAALDADLEPGNDSSGTHAALQPCPAPSPEELAAAEESRQLVAAAIAALPPRARAVLQLYCEGLSTPRVCSKLHLTEWQVDHARQSALKQLRAELARDCGASLTSLNPVQGPLF